MTRARFPIGDLAKRLLQRLFRRRWVRALVALGSACAIASLVSLIYVYSSDYDLGALEAGGPLVITDRHGEMLRSVPSPSGRPGRNAWVELKDVPGAVVATVLRSEDVNFYEHAGVDPVGIARACLLNLSRGRLAFGGSTLTMQLVKLVHHPGEPRTLVNKLKEMVLALRLERAASKQQILEHYLNRVYYGNGAYGIEAAAQRYFSKPASALSTGEATLLATIPRAPTAYDPLINWDTLRARQLYLLSKLAASGQLPEETAELARTEPIELRPRTPAFEAPHFVDWVISELPQAVVRHGGVVRTSLDLSLQRALEHRVAEHVAELTSVNMKQAGLVVLDTQTSTVRAMVGASGAESVNITTWRRHPGSALKPFVYAAAIEAGDTPSSIALDIHDVPSEYRNRALTQPEHGPVRYREALAGSYNLAAVHVLEKVGIPRVLSALRTASVGPFESDPEDYGLRLALGAPKVRLIDLAAGYGFLVDGGQVRPPSAVLDVELSGGAKLPAELPRKRRVFSEQTSWLVMDMLADPHARREAFGNELPFDLPYPIAAKTGTSRGFADTVAIGATHEFIVAAWGGNFDGTSTQGLIAMQAAAPLVRAGLLAAADGTMLTLPAAPHGIAQRNVCALSGMLAGEHCPHHKLEHFDVRHLPERSCDWHVTDDHGSLRLQLPEPVRRFRERQMRRAGVELAH